MTSSTPGVLALKFLLALAQDDNAALREALGVIQDAEQAAELLGVLADIILGSLEDPVPYLTKCLREAELPAAYLKAQP